MSTRKMKRSVYTILVYSMLALLELMLAGFCGWLEDMSWSVVKYAPELAHMRIPVLWLGRSMAVIMMVAVVMVGFLVYRVLRGKAYTLGTIKLVKVLSAMAFLMVIPLVALYIYTEMNVKGSITNLWVIFGLILSLGAGAALALVAELVQEGHFMKSENDLTI